MTMHKAGLGRYFEDFAVGDVYQHPLGRTINEADCTWFTLLTCNLNQNHFNADYASRNPVSQGKILVNSGLTIALVLGLSVLDMSQNAVANLGLTDLALTRPVYVGDTIYAESVCTGSRPSASRPGYGIVEMRTRGLNQGGETVMSWQRSALIPGRESGIGQDYFPAAKDGPLA
ncbi:MaoC family dehydratase [Rhodococcoides kyotonense]|uniref:Acyl dehydratase n=1 Tax=Rhodococcoides kyotonense TaxID=398843 RepID=A0A239M1L9_9NOCA|nr:MaoC family dehydratase [Rhodococcus kyotonensis]SNT36192.1 Acyl dehydratase [Rhodococcus kyotonensis]